MPVLPAPAHLKRLHGNPGKRRIPQELPVELLPDVPPAPAFLTVHAVEMWQRLGADLAHLRLLTSGDLNMLGSYCAAYARWRAAQELLGRRDDPRLLQVAREAGREMMRYGRELGVLGAVRLSGDPGPGRSKFAGLMG